MTIFLRKNTYEKGNVVTLTLLGLSVAILAGVVVLYLIGKTKPEPIHIPEVVDEEVVVEEEKEEVSSREGWGVYTNTMYNFSFEYPPGWIVATGTLSTGDPAISAFPAQNNSTSTVYSHQDIATHVSFYPLGVATEGLQATEKKSEVTLEALQGSIKDYVLKSGRPWATKAVFETYPESWNESGFIFMRLVVEEEELLYMRGNTEIEQYEFDPITGDHIERSGFVDTNMRELQKEILQSFTFIDENGTASGLEESKIVVDEPIPNQVVTSPQTVKGQIPGDWYFGDEYPIRLETSNGETVTESFITSVEEWDSETSISFEVSLVFEEPNATSGVLIIGSGGSESDETKTEIPVLF